MVRLVFRPYTQILRSICTLESLRASTRVSSGFTLFRHSSPSFGSQQIRSCSDPPESRMDRPMMRRRGVRPATALTSAQPTLNLHFHCARGLAHPKTRAHVRLLGPCFKTGRARPFGRQRPRHLYAHTTTRPRQDTKHCVQSSTPDTHLTTAG